MLHLSANLFFVLCLAFVPCSPALLAQANKCPPSSGQINMTQGTYSPQPGVSFLLHHFNARLVPQGDRAPLCYGKFTVVSRAVILVSNDSLTHLLSQKLADTGSKIRDFQVINSADGVTLKGTMDKLVPIHFSIFGPVTTDGTALLMHADKVNADGIPIKALLALVGQHLSSVLGMKGVAGVSVQENTMSFFPEQIAHLKGNLHSVVTSANGLTLTYTPVARPAVLVRAAAK